MSTNFDKVGTVSNGETYDVYAIDDVNNTGFTWYQIGCNRWVADDGTWLTYTPKQ